MVLFLASGCAAPAFTIDTCLSQCTQCPGIPCDVVCEALQTGLESGNCHNASEDVWLCAIDNGCNFPTVCEEEVTTFLECVP